jgi:hypothetical protein
MRTIAIIGATLLASLVMSAFSLGPTPGSGPCNVSGPGNFQGAPPPWVIPSGGREAVVTHLDGSRTCTITRSDGSLFGRAFTDERGRPHRVEYYDGLSRIFYDVDIDYPKDGATAQQRVPYGFTDPDRCSTSPPQTANPEADTWEYSTINWYINDTSIPNNTWINRATAITHIRNAHAQWENNTTHCSGIGDGSTLDFNYSGTSSGTPRQKDNLSIVVRQEAQPNCTSAAIGCETTWYSVLTGKVIESDIVLDDDFPLTTSPGTYTNRYDIWSLTAHEVGHRALFGHVGDHRMVMDDEGLELGNILYQKLSRGDAIGNNNKY